MFYRNSTRLKVSASLTELFKLEPLDAVALIKRGVPARLLVRISRELGLPVKQIAQLLGLAHSTVARKVKANATLNIHESECVLGLAKLIGQVQAIVDESGGPESFDAGRWVSAWISRPSAALGGRCPGNLMDTGEGREIVSELVSRMQSGAYS